MFSLVSSAVFVDWLDGLADQKARARILERLTRARLGNFGDCTSVGEGVSECVSMSGPVTGSNSSAAGLTFTCCSPAA